MSSNMLRDDDWPSIFFSHRTRWPLQELMDVEAYFLWKHGGFPEGRHQAHADTVRHNWIARQAFHHSCNADRGELGNWLLAEWEYEVALVMDNIWRGWLQDCSAFLKAVHRTCQLKHLERLVRMAAENQVRPCPVS